MTGNIGNKGGFVSGGNDTVALGKLKNKIQEPDIEHILVHNTELYDSLTQGIKGGFQADCRLQ